MVDNKELKKTLEALAMSVKSIQDELVMMKHRAIQNDTN